MKHVVIFAFLTISHLLNSQTTQIVRRVVPLQEKLTFSLDGGLTSSVNGQSRVYFQFDLPENTVEWYYIFSSQSDVAGMKSAASTINLASQLTRAFDPTGASAVATNSLLAPSGSEQCNVYVFPSYDEAINFYNKTDQSLLDDPFVPDPTCSIEAATQGKVKVTSITEGRVYMGIQNPSFNSTVNVVIEVAAIVEEEVVNLDEWSSETKDYLYANYVETFMANGAEEETADLLANCMVEKITSSYLPADFSNRTEQELLTIESTIADECFAQLGGGEKTEEEEKGSTVGSMAWSAYENGDLEKAITYSKKALEYDNTLGWVHGNLGLFYLIKNDELTALDYYLDAITQLKKDRLNGKATLQELINDINNAKKNYPNLNGYQEILTQLQREIDNF
jgi:tetratricopeptide (TPR) repeat protein